MAPKSAPTPHTPKPVFGRLGLSLPFGFFLNRLPIRPLYPPLPRLRPPPAPGIFGGAIAGARGNQWPTAARVPDDDEVPGKYGFVR